jgi:hypothetical protein
MQWAPLAWATWLGCDVERQHPALADRGQPYIVVQSHRGLARSKERSRKSTDVCGSSK